MNLVELAAIYVSSEKRSQLIMSATSIRRTCENVLFGLMVVGVGACGDQRSSDILTAPSRIVPGDLRHDVLYPDGFVAQTVHISSDQASGSNYALVRCPEYVAGIGYFEYSG